MDREQGMILAKLRLDRAKELVTESQELMEKGAYKSLITERSMPLRKVSKHCLLRSWWK